MSNNIERLKEMYDEIKIPENIDFVVSKGIKKGRKKMKTKKRNMNILKSLTSVAAAFLIFAFALNASPAFANSVRQLPGGETITRLLVFVDGTAVGGEITDGQDISDIQVDAPSNEKAGEENAAEVYYETLTVDLYQGMEAASIAGAFTVTQKTHPYSIEVHLAGVRAFSAADAFPNLEDKKLFDSIYRLITLDDSAHRFVVTFKKPVLVEVTEQENPASLIIKVRADEEAAESMPMYSLRTASLPFGEVVGIAEEILRFELGSENARLLMDETGLYIAEEGLYNTKEEAETRLAELANADNFLYTMHIEKRNPEAKPSFIAE